MVPVLYVSHIETNPVHFFTLLYSKVLHFLFRLCTLSFSQRHLPWCYNDQSAAARISDVNFTRYAPHDSCQLPSSRSIQPHPVLKRLQTLI